jgi:hypothetical protein
MATSPNYAWAEPDNSSLVKNGAADIRTLGDAIDASLWAVGFGQAGKNKIINGDMGIWQRGTSISYTGSAAVAYSADRFYHYSNGNGAWTFSQQALTPASIAGYESAYFARASLPTAGTTTVLNWGQRIEDVRTFANQTATLSFWAKADSARSINWYAQQNFGSGGSANVDTTTSNFSITTSWTRFSVAISIPSISGKTIGAGSYLAMFINAGSITSGFALDLWGVQVEYGSKATPFETATGTLQGELAACQRYYYRQTGDNLYANFGFGTSSSTTIANLFVIPPVTMRVKPSSVEYSTLRMYDGGSGYTVTALTLENNFNGATQAAIQATSSGMTVVRPTFIQGNGSASAYLGFSAEL